MPNMKVMDMTGKEVGEITLSDAVFGAEVNAAVLHLAVRQYLANQRQGTQSTKTRTEVSGGGRKPWRQKGTGRARQGSTRSPQWTHGGVVFAPKPRDYTQSIPRKMKRLALKCALSAKVSAGELVVLDELKLSQPKTREMAAVMKALGAEKALVVLKEKDESVLRASGNIQALKLAYVNTINVYDILKYDKLVILQAALPKVEEVYA